MMRWSKRKLWICCLFSFIAIVMLASEINSATLGQLDAFLRRRVNEVDIPTSIFDTVVGYSWINQAQDRVVLLAGYLPKFVDFAYVPAGDTAFFRLPADFRSVKKVLIYSQGRYYQMLPNPGFIKDTGLMTYDVIWSTPDSAHFVFQLGGFQDVQTDIIYDGDSSSYRLPADFRNATGVMVWMEQWEPVIPNPLFLKDVGTRQFDIHWKHRDTALLYLRGAGFQEDDTVRVFYQKTLQANDTVRVEYLGTATDMSVTTDASEVPDDLEEFIVEEAIGYYFLYRGDKIAAQAIWEQVRIDMGVLKPGGQQ